MEAGRDGVGDYTRLIAGELDRMGHSVRVIALNDWHAASRSDRNVMKGDAGCGRIDIMRLAAGDPWEKRFRAAAEIIEEFAPDWISIQFVCYGFQKRGLAFGVGRRLRDVAMGANVHLMLHELWIGEAVEYGMKDRLMGWMQKRIILGCIKAVDPTLIHTSNRVYAAMLARCGMKADQLPLFGNIPIARGSSAEWFCEQLRKRGVEIGVENRAKFFIGGIFGAVHPQWSIIPLNEMVCTCAREEGKRVLYVAIGRRSARDKALRGHFSGEAGNGVAVFDLGEQHSTEISMYLQNVDYGISACPLALIGKSGSVAAMLEHGLPVVVGRDEWKLRRGPTPLPAPHPQLLEQGAFVRTARCGQLIKQSAVSRLPDVAAKMLADLSSTIRASKNGAADRSFASSKIRTSPFKWWSIDRR